MEAARTTEFRILGPLEVLDDGSTVSLGGPQQRRILAVLLSERGRVLTYERLVEVLWPSADEPPNARKSAITYVSRLRAVLGDGVVQTTDVGYVVDTRAVSVDADRFVALLEHARTLSPERSLEVLDEALALWRGPTFGDLSGEWWARPLAKKLEELRLSAMADRVDAMAAPGWDGRAIAEVTSLVDAHPLREQFVEKAMRGLHAVGQTADALRVYHRYRTDLADQTGLDPSDALRDLEASIATGSELEPSSVDLARPLRGYVLRELVGEGSFGHVYRATQPGVQRDVAIKVIRRELADDRTFIRRFEAEAQLVARLEHPHIVPLYDFWRQPGGAFLVFRLMRGGSADQRLAHDGPFSLERAGEVLMQIGGALAAAHAEHVVHRDVKPANILFDDAGLAYLADFGIAASLSAEQSAPQRWSAGSALYASPEQLRDGVEDARADQYSLALTIWELLTGRTPFDGHGATSVVATKLRQPLGPVDEICPIVPDSVSAVLTRAGAVHPLDRYASVAELVTAWQRAMAGATDRDRRDGDSMTYRATRVAAATMLGIGRAVSNPYKGLRAFREGDAAEFHGRDSLVGELASLVASASFTAVVGPSGSGKSSLVLAGLIPRLRSAQSLVAVMTPGENPFAALAVALGQIAGDRQADLLSLSALRRDEGLRDALGAIAAGDDVVLVIDQLEELWTLTNEDERHLFLTALVGPIVAGDVRVVATVRADFFDRPLADATIGPLVAQNAFGLTPMTATELHVAITAPADQVGVRADPALVSRLVADTIDQPGSLPLLQFTLAELFERRRGALITLDAYEELGGLAGSLSRQADELYDAFDVGDRATVRRLFTRLVTPGDGTEDTRRRVLVGDLASVPERVVAAFVNRRLLTTDRDRATREPTIEIAHEVLLRSWPRLRVWLDEDRSWLRELRSLTAATTLWDVGGRDVGDLYRAGRLAVVTDLVGAHPGSLTELEQQFLIESQDHDAEEHREAQRRLEEKTRQNRRLRRSLIGIAAVLVLAIGAGAVALVQRQRATRAQRTAVAQRADADAQRLDADAQRADAESQRVIADEQRELADEQRTAAETAAAAANASATAAATAKTAAQLATLASRSLSSRSSQRDLAALLAVEAWQRSHDADAESALFGTFTFDQGFLGYLRFEQANGIGLIGIPGTRDVLVQGFGAANGPGSDSTRVVDATTGEEIVRLDPLFDGGVAHVNTTVSANGRFAAQWVTPALNGPTPDAPSLAAVFDLATGHVVGSPIEILNYVPSMFGVDDSGSRLAVLSDFAGAVAVYDTATASVVATIAPLAGVEETFEFEDIGTAVYGPDGRLYVGTRGDRLRVYDPVSFSMVEEIVTPVDATAGWVEFSSDGMVLVSRGVSLDPDSGEQLGTLTRIDLPTATVAWHLAGADYGYGECNTFAFRTESDQLFCGDYNGLVRERSLSTGGRTGRVLQNQKGTLTDLSIVPVSDGTMLVAGNTTAPVMSRWRIDGGGPVQRLVASGHQIIGKISPDVLLVGRANGRPSPFDLDYSLWDVTEDTEIPGLPAFAFAFAVGDHVFGWIDVDTVAVYEVSTGHVRVFDVHIDDLPTSVTASRDGEVLLLGFGDGSAVAYEANTGTVIQHFQLPATTDGHVPFVNQAAISDDHTRAYFASGELFAFDVVTGAEVAHNVENLRIGYVTVGPNGVVAAGSWDGAFGLFDAETLNETAALPGGRSGMSIAAFSDDGDVLFASANDGTAHLYDVTSHVRLGDPIDLRIPGGGAVSLSPDGLSAAVALPNRTGVVMWDLDPADWAVAACVIAGRNLTRDEWATYLGDLGTYHATCPQYPSG